MRIPNRFAPFLFSALLSAIMVSIVTAFVLFRAQGLHDGFPAQWLRSCLTTWPVAFAAVFVVAPVVRRAVARITALVALALVSSVSHSAQAQSTTGPRSHWEFLATSGRLLPTGDQRSTIADTGLTATLAWARSRDATLAKRPKLDAFLYNARAGFRTPRLLPRPR